MPFSTTNYLWACAGFLLLLAGFLLMYTDDSLHGFSWRSLTMAPLLLVAGFGLQLLAIFHRHHSG